MDDRTVLFVVRPGLEAPLVLEAGLSRATWEELLVRQDRELRMPPSYRRGDLRDALVGNSGRMIGAPVAGSRGPAAATWAQPLRPLLEGALLEGVTRFVIAPENAGHLIPWSLVAHVVGKHAPDGQPLPCLTVPTLSLLPRLHTRRHERDGTALVVGNPEANLSYAEQEAREIAAVLGTTPLLGGQATKDEVLAGLSRATIIHIGAHAVFHPTSPLDSGIILSDETLTAREVLAHRLQADLLVLSACQTGMARPLAGDELAGLAYAFLSAGAQSVLMSLWKVDDAATRSLMVSFYAALRTGIDKAQALASAMASTQMQQQWCDPYYWGAFVLIGNW